MPEYGELMNLAEQARVRGMQLCDSIPDEDQVLSPERLSDLTSLLISTASVFSTLGPEQGFVAVSGVVKLAYYLGRRDGRNSQLQFMVAEEKDEDSLV